MPKTDTQTRLSKRDIELIVGVVVRAYYEGRTVAEIVEHRLVQNETALSMCEPPKRSARAKGRKAAIPDPEYRLITAETRRILRLRQRFASWQRGQTQEPEAQ